MSLLTQGIAQVTAAVKAGMSERTARKYWCSGRSPSQEKVVLTWRTLPDPFEEALPEIETLLRQDGGLSPVVPSDDGRSAIDPKLITRGVARCQEQMEKLGIAKFNAHDLRRTVRTGLARLKIAPHIAERVLNHAQERIPGTYDMHDYLEEKREDLER